MAGFDNNTLTVQGLNAIATATVESPIHFTKALASSTYYEPASVVEDNLEITGTIAAASATDAEARVVAAFTGADETGVLIKTIALFGYVGDESNEVMICAASDSDSQIHTSSIFTAFIAVHFDIADVAVGSFTSSAGAFATLGDLDRFVSAHKAGDVSAGENQSIYGVKTFQDGVTATVLYTSDVHTETIHAYNDDIYIGSAADAQYGCKCTIRLDTTFSTGLTANWAALGYATLSGTLTVSGNVAIGGGLTVDGSTMLGNDVLVDGGVQAESITGNTLDGVLTTLYSSQAGALVRLSLTLSGSSGSSGTATINRGTLIKNGQTIATTGVSQTLIVASEDVTVTSSMQFAVLHKVQPSYSGTTSTAIEVDAIIRTV